jgi:hypothetical protein
MFEPNHGHYDPRLIRRQYEGSSLEIGPDRARWVPPAFPPFHRGGFTVPIGGQPGQAHAVTRIRTAFTPRRGAKPPRRVRWSTLGRANSSGNEGA